MRLSAYWNGIKCEMEVIRIRLIESNDVPLLYWGKPFYGQDRQAIRVFAQGGSFVIDNEDGMGYNKLTVGMGSPRYGHRSIFAYEEIGTEAPIDIIKWNPMTHDFIEHKIREWQHKHHPDDYEKLRALEREIDRMRNSDNGLSILN